MPFIFLMLFGLICLETNWRAHPDWLTPAGCAILVSTMVIASWLSAELISRTIAWQLLRHPEQRTVYLRRYFRWRLQHFIVVLIVYLVMLYLLGWGHILEVAWRDSLEWWGFEIQHNNLPGFQVGLMVPFFSAVLLAWERFYRVEKTAYEMGHTFDCFITKPAYMLMQIRHQMLFVLPPILFLLMQQILAVFIPHWGEASYPAVIVGIVLMVSMFGAMPLLLRIFLGLKPLPPGPLRDRLEHMAQRLNFRFSNVLLWDTRNLVANALVTGFVPWVRYIVLTDRLIEELTPDEIEAVFGHEIGHIKHHHLLFYLTFFITSFILLGFFWDVVKQWLKQEHIMAELQMLPYFGENIRETLRTLSSFGKLGLLAGYTLLIFGFLSRRCERQADLFGSQTVSFDAFINALEKVAAINGIPRDRAGNWPVFQHPTIAQRIEFLQEMRDNPSRIPRFHTSIHLMQLALLYFLVFLFWYFPLSTIFKFLMEF